jgi:hypothetical protein
MCTPSTRTDDENIKLDFSIPYTEEECMEMGICHQCSHFFTSVLEFGLCSYCDEVEWERKVRGIPDEVCSWEEVDGKIHYSTLNGCLCGSHMEVENLWTTWENTSWPGGFCSLQHRNAYKKKIRDEIAEINRSIRESLKMNDRATDSLQAEPTDVATKYESKIQTTPRINIV